MMHSEPMSEIWGLLTEEQKKKVVLMKLDLKIQWMEMKISDMEKMIGLKRKKISGTQFAPRMTARGVHGLFTL